MVKYVIKTLTATANTKNGKTKNVNYSVVTTSTKQSNLNELYTLRWLTIILKA